MSRVECRPGLATPEDLAALLGVPFSAEQLEAITAPLAPGVIIAGAGTGKTTVMAARVVWLVGTDQVSADRVLGLTFTRKAAHELGSRIGHALLRAGLQGHGDDSGRALIATYDAFAGDLLAAHALRIGAEPDQQLITGAVRHRLAGQVVSRWPGELPGLGRFRPATLVERILKLDSELRAHLVDPAAVLSEDEAFAHELAQVKLSRGKVTQPVSRAQETIGERRELLAMVGRYRELKADRGFVEFADQMARAAELVAGSPVVGRQLRDGFSVVLLDEYQDTSAAQAQLLRGLFSGPDQSSGRGHPVTAVGDPFQAIYGWRGAAPSNIQRFATEFPRADGQPAQSHALTVNRRSRPVILDAANAVAKPLRSDARLTAGQARLLRAPADTVGGELEVAGFDTWPQEVAWLADRVVAAKRSGTASEWSEVAVLTRQNAPIAAIFAELVARGIPVEIVGLGGLLELPEVADVVATLRLIDDATANPEALRLLAGARWRIGPRDLALVGSRARELVRSRRQSPAAPTGSVASLTAAAEGLDPTEQVSLLDAIEDLGNTPVSDTARQRFADFAAELRTLRRHRDEPLLELTGRVIETLGIALELDSDCDWFAAQRSHQLDRFCDAVAGYVDIDGDGSLSGLLAWLQAEWEQAEGLDQATPSSEDSVKLLTVHRAKGLEWDVVFLPLLCEGVFPTGQAPDNWTSRAEVVPSALRGDSAWVPHLGEPSTARLKTEYPAELRSDQRQAEDRLAYVAITRARRLVVASAHHWFPGRVHPRKPSPYFRELAARAEELGAPIRLSDASVSNPLLADEVLLPWPEPEDVARRAALDNAAELVRLADSGDSDRLAPPSLDDARRRADWHRLAVGLVREARQRRSDGQQVIVPKSLSASNLMLASRDPAAFTSQLLRPMPRPTGRQASVGSRFHQWLEGRFGPAPLLDEFEPRCEEPDELDAPAADRQFARLVQAFERGQYADRVPVCIEEPFIATIGDHQVRGRIDAVFRLPDDPEHDYQVVDWKTSNRPADPLQLSLYRYAWARSCGLPLERVAAVFYHVLTDEVEQPAGLLDEAALLQLVNDLAAAGRATDGDGTNNISGPVPDSLTP